MLQTTKSDTSIIKWKYLSFLKLVVIFSVAYHQSFAQELEPRSLSNVPVGTNFAAIAYGYAAGNVLFDPALPLENVQAKTHAIAAAYVRSFNFLGMGAKFNVGVPMVAGNWDGIYQGIETSTSRTGIADMRFGFSFNFIGSPAFASAEYKNYKQKTIVGFSFQTIAPTGQYYPDKLINLGSNRWAFRPQLGMSHKHQSWYFELMTNIWLYTINNSFWNGNKLEQKPIGTIKGHIIKSFKKGIWAAVGTGYAFGGQAFVNDVKKDAKISTLRFGAIVAIPLNAKHSIKLTALSAKRFEEGADFDAFSIAYQYMWNNKTKN